MRVTRKENTRYRNPAVPTAVEAHGSPSWPTARGIHARAHVTYTARGIHARARAHVTYTARGIHKTYAAPSHTAATPCCIPQASEDTPSNTTVGTEHEGPNEGMFHSPELYSMRVCAPDKYQCAASCQYHEPLHLQPLPPIFSITHS